MKLTAEESLQWFEKIRESRLYKLARFNLNKQRFLKNDDTPLHPVEILLEGIRLIRVIDKKGLSKKFQREL